MSTSKNKTSVIKIINTSRRFGKTLAVDAISLKIEQGCTFGLLGTNGAGKTTLINMLCGLLKPSAGKIEILGHNIIKDTEKIRKNIAIVPQEISLYSDLTVLENLEFFGRLYIKPSKLLRKRMSSLLNIVGLLDKKDKKIRELSGGFKRRCSIACALISNPKILFFDEPLTGIDISTKKLVLDLIAKQKDLTVIFTTHSISDAEEICDKVAFMDEGKIMLRGMPKKLIKKYSKKIGSPASKTNLEDVFEYVMCNEN